MSEFRKRGADGSHVPDPDSGFALLGFDGSITSPPIADTRVPTVADSPDATVADTRVPTVAAPVTRRELRAREQAELNQLSPQAPAIQTLLPLASVPQESTATQESTARQSMASSTSSPKVKAPRKPMSLRPVKQPRGMSRPRVSAPPRVSSPPRNASAPLARKKSLKRKMLSKLMTFGAMIGAGLMMVSTSLPANAFYSVEATNGTVAAAVTPVAAAEVQSMKVASVGDQTFTRDNYTAVSLRERLFLKFGNRNWTYSNNPNGTIQWPFPIAVPISSGFGERIAPCGGCSSFHEGLDFTPGGGTAIQVIADGVVSKVAEDAWGLGSHVVIDHIINGKLIQSVYGHMQRGSIRVTLGQQVKVTDIVGLVGSTGISTGDHLHFEIHVNGVQVDPFTWLKANAN